MISTLVKIWDHFKRELVKWDQSAGIVEYTNYISAASYLSTSDIKLSDCEALVILELWEMQSTHLLLSLQDTLWPGVVVPERTPSMGQIELFDI